MVDIHMKFTATLDARFGDTDTPSTWESVRAALADAELYWLTTVRGDGRPHTVPLVGVWHDDGFAFSTGPEEQKARNLEGHGAVTVTTGANTWTEGLDVVVEGAATRVTGLAATTALADAYREKYHGDWDYTPTEDGFDMEGNAVLVFRVDPAKVLAFGKGPYRQTRFTPARSQ
jgi:nitroimidazol reductase NimA-like FMN-containing flavoprotein (pyridoxamine 5'-phosphate oxidase superfamily)